MDHKHKSIVEKFEPLDCVGCTIISAFMIFAVLFMAAVLTTIFTIIYIEITGRLWESICMAVVSVMFVISLSSVLY